jgi:hypothetical protein
VCCLDEFWTCLIFIVFLVVEFVVAIGEVRNLRYSVAAASVSVSRRRACSDDTLMFRRAATARGESCRFKASKVARTML